jgi:hypothetical protein
MNQADRKVLGAMKRAGVLLLMVGSMCVPLSARAQLSISSSGTPNYQRLIAVPPGVAGMAPKLALSYKGGGTGGSVGYGWSVDGVSIISRCPATAATDGKRAPVNFGPSDKLCLNGERLIQTDQNGNALAFPQLNDATGLASGAYREFRTEKDSYARIRAYGYANGDTSGNSGPQYFLVWTKSGQIIEYGDSPSKDSNTNSVVYANAPGQTAAMLWAVTRISDVVGNHVDYKYEQFNRPWGSFSSAVSGSGNGSEWNVKEIQYSGNKVIFNYVDRSEFSPQDKAEAYNLGSKTISVRLLTSITTYINSPNTSVLGSASSAVAVKTLNLIYDNGAVTHRSRLHQVRECAGDLTSSTCLPAETFNYSDGGGVAYVVNNSFNLSGTKLFDPNGSMGIVQGDFNGDGRTDILRWGDDSSQNALYLSNGDGSFSSAANFNITTQNLFKSDGCYASVVADVNGDGLPDLIRYSGPTSTSGAACTTYGSTVVYLNNGDGTFTQRAYAGPTLKRDTTTTFYFFDVNGDGKADLVTSLAGAWTRQNAYSPIFVYRCTNSSGVCTHVYQGNGDGSFTEVATNIAGSSVYTPPAGNPQINAPTNLQDLDGDGLLDLVVPGSGETYQGQAWRSVGDWTFAAPSFTAGCNSPALYLDFNGDGRPDCIHADTSVPPAANSLQAGGSSAWGYTVSNFDLTHAGQELAGTGVGTLIGDINGDGRQDIIRWKDDASQNAVFLSNGDGTFCPPGTSASGCPSSSFNFTGIQLGKSDGTVNSVVGDFTGHGNSEILRLQTNGGAISNQLFVKSDPTPADTLKSVISSNGAVTTLYQVPLSNPVPSNGVSANLGPRYQTDSRTANSAMWPVVDITLPNYVVATAVTDSGVGSATVTTEYSYAGLKTDLLGRGLLGFREMISQAPAPDGSAISTDTQFLQIQPYIGSPLRSATYNRTLNAINGAPALGTVQNLYCDQTAPSGAATNALSSNVSCTTPSKVQRPYLLRSVQSGHDLNGAQLPTVSTQTSVSPDGDPLNVTITSQANSAAGAQTFQRQIANVYQPDNTACAADNVTCKWIIGRLSQTTVSSTVPNSLSSIPTSAGNSPNATATQGSGPPVAPPVSPAVLSVILQLLLDD